MIKKDDQLFLAASGGAPLAGKVVLIVGGGSEYGRALAVTLAQNGADIALVYHPQAMSQVQKTRRLVRKQDQMCLTLPEKIFDRQGAQAIVHAVEAQFGHLDIFLDVKGQYTDHAQSDGKNGNNGQNFVSFILPRLDLLVAALRQIALCPED